MYFPSNSLPSPLSLLLSEKTWWDGVKEDVWREREARGQLVN